MASIPCRAEMRPDRQNGLAITAEAFAETSLTRVSNPHHQCAWCGRLMRRRTGVGYGPPYPVPLPATSHGICLRCARQAWRAWVTARREG